MFGVPSFFAGVSIFAVMPWLIVVTDS